MSFEARASSYTWSYYVALAIRTGVSLGWLATICWLARLDERAFLRLPRLSLSRRVGLRWAPSYQLKLALWHLLHGRLAEAARANPLVFVVTYLACDLTWQTYRSLLQHLTRSCAPTGATPRFPRDPVGISLGRHTVEGIPVDRVLVGVGDPQQQRVVEETANELHAGRQTGR